MAIIIRAVVVLEQGARLYYNPPLKGDSFASDAFFDTHGGKYATFEGYVTDLVNILDSQGRMPGQYINLDGIKVRFDGEEKIQELNARHFIVADPVRAKLVSGNSANDQRLGDLLHPILFYPGDLVSVVGKAKVSDVPRPVKDVFIKPPFAVNGIPRYEIWENQDELEERKARAHEKIEKRGGYIGLQSFQRDSFPVDESDIRLVQRGNIWALYNDPSKLVFASVSDEVSFWLRPSVSKCVSGSDVDAQGLQASTISSVLGRSFDDVWQLFLFGEADLIEKVDRSRYGEVSTIRYTMRKLHDCFAEHRERVRALTTQLWGHQFTELVT